MYTLAGVGDDDVLPIYMEKLNERAGKMKKHDESPWNVHQFSLFTGKKLTSFRTFQELHFISLSLSIS